MNTQQILLVQNSFAQVQPISDETATLFYERLFELNDSLRILFPVDLRVQKHKLMTTLSFAVAGLYNPEAILPTIRDLGRRHVAYGVQLPHYDLFGQALLFALQQGLGEQFTAEVEEAWLGVFEVLATALRDGANEVTNH